MASRISAAQARLGSTLAAWCVAGVAFGQAPPPTEQPAPAATEATPTETQPAPSPNNAATTEPETATDAPSPNNAASAEPEPEAAADATSPKAPSKAPARTESPEASAVKVHEVEPQGRASAFDLSEPAPPPGASKHEAASRKAELGGVAGMLFRAADGGDVTYSAGPAYGGYARVQIRHWITARLMVTQSSHGVSIRRGTLGIADTTIEQPEFTLLEMSARVEPTWVVLPEFRLRGVLGLGWGRISVPAATSSGALELTGPERFGVMLDATSGVSASYDLIIDRLSLDLSVDGGLVWGESGSAFEEVQVFDADGHRHFMGRMPDFNGTFSALVGLGVVL